MEEKNIDKCGGDIQHDNYANPCHIIITRGKDGNYTLRYEDEGYEYFCSSEELLEELAEHIELMTTGENYGE